MLNTFEEYQNLVDNAFVGIYKTDTAGNFIYANRALVEMLGLSTFDELKKYKSTDLYADQAEREQLIKEISEKSHVTNYRIDLVRPDGNDLFALISAQLVENKLFGMFHDITEQVKSQRELEKSEKKYRDLVDNSLIGVYTAKLNGELQFCNTALANMFGYSTTEEMLEHQLEITHLNQEPLDELVKLVVEHGYVKEFRTTFRKLNGEKIHLLFNSRLEKDYMTGVLMDITESIKTEKALIQSEEMHREILSSVTEAIFITDKKGSFTYVCPNVFFIFGINYEEAIQIGNIKYLLSEKFLFNGELETKEEIKNLEYRITDKFGTDKDILVSARKVKINKGRILYTCRDITEKKQSENELKTLNHNLLKAQEIAQLGSWEWNLQDDTFYISEELYKIIGYPKKEVKPTPEFFSNIIPEEDLKRLESSLNKAISEGTGYSFEHRIKRPDGEIRHVLSQGEVEFENSKPLRLFGSILDITERKKTEQQLQYLSKLRALLIMLSTSFINAPLDTINTAINYALEEMGNFVNADRAYIFDYDFEHETTTNTYEWCRDGITPEIDNLQDLPLNLIPEWVDTHLKGEYMYVDDVDKLPESGLKDVLQPQGIKSLITIPMMHNNECIGFTGFDFVNSTYEYSENEQQLLTVFAQMLVNIRNREENENELVEAKEKAERSNKLKSEFLSQMSHEIRTPINVILNFSSLLKEEVSDYLDKESLKEFDIINSAGRRIIRTIDLILNMSEIQAGTYEPIMKEINFCEDILESLIKEYLHSADIKGIKLSVEKKCYDCSIAADDYSVTQIFANLIDNAIKYTNEGEVKVIVESEGDGLRVKVADTGIGISEEYLPDLFKPFTQEDEGYSRKYEGNGLGLALVKNYCKINNAEISVESEKNVGTTFTVKFPLN